LLDKYIKIRYKIVLLYLTTIIRLLKDKVQLKIEKKVLDGSIPRCPGCGKDGATRCGGCGSVWYCSMKCQENHWSLHESKCLLQCHKPALPEDIEPSDPDVEKLLEDASEPTKPAPPPITTIEGPPLFGEDEKLDDTRLSEMAVKEGYLWKQGGWFNTWKKRYFILTPNELSYCRETTKEETKRWRINLTDAKFQLEPALAAGRPYSFSIAPKDSKRKFILAGETEEVMNVWAASIRTQLGEKVIDQKIQEILTTKKKKHVPKREKHQRHRLQGETVLQDSYYSKDEKRQRKKDLRKAPKDTSGTENQDPEDESGGGVGPTGEFEEDLDDFQNGSKTSIPLKSPTKPIQTSSTDEDFL